uniref:Uncharacterized protein n=1 Tax=Jaculus jaculus TaxID=51337 RepID=A0A8C5LA23_JACJA
LFGSFFNSLVGKDVVVKLKNNLNICGTPPSVDRTSTSNPEKYPHMWSVKNFIQGSVVVDTQSPQDAARKEN